MPNNLIHLRERSISTNLEQEVFLKNAKYFCDQWINGKESFSLKTSGSTGEPKLIDISRSQMTASAKMTADALNLRAGHNVLISLNTNYIAGKMMLVRCMVNHLSMYITEPSSNPLENVPADLEIDFMAVVPLQMETMWVAGEYEIEILNKMKAVLIGGGPVSPSLHSKIKKLKCPVYHTYGMTETVSHIALKRLNGASATDYFEVLPDVKVGQDDRGCLTINSIVTSHKTIVTNDIVNLIDEHHFEWLGRSDHIINSGGVKIHPEQLETQIKEVTSGCTWIKNLIIAGFSDDKLGQKIVLVIEANQMTSDDEKREVLEVLKKKLSSYHTPKEIYILDHFIYTDTHKVKRKETLKLLS